MPVLHSHIITPLLELSKGSRPLRPPRMIVLARGFLSASGALIKELTEATALQSALHIDAATAAPMGVGMMRFSEYRPNSLAVPRHES